jgi:hypothetical protein
MNRKIKKSEKETLVWREEEDGAARETSYQLHPIGQD